MSFKLVMFNTANEFEAKKIARNLLASNLAMDIDLVKTTKLVGSSDLIDEAVQYLVLAKTIDEKLKDVLKVIYQQHSSSTPNIVLLDIVGGSRRFLDRLEHQLTLEPQEEPMPEIDLSE